MKEPTKMKRVVVYVGEDDYNLLRSKLILARISVSQWVREKIKEYLSENKTNE